MSLVTAVVPDVCIRCC